MEGLGQFQTQLKRRVAAGGALGGLLVSGLWLVSDQLPGGLPAVFVAVLGVLLAGLFGLVFGIYLGRTAATPFRYFWDALRYAGKQPGAHAPDLTVLRVAQELTNATVHELYQLAMTEDVQLGGERLAAGQAAQTALAKLPLPVAAINRDLHVVYVNDSLAQAYGVSSEAVVGLNVNEALHLSFPSEDTLERWLEENLKSAVTDTRVWQRVRLTDAAGKMLRQGDLVGYFNNGLGNQLLATLTFFDRSETYGRDDSEINFVALAVHELRTPLTIMRGYVEVFEEELAGSLDPELQDFLRKLSASTQQLTAFISNILNVARVEADQLELHLEEQSWPEILHAVGADMDLRAKTNGRRLEYNIHSGLPSVAADRVSIYEVLINLIDNAIKYSGRSPRIVISTRLNKEGMVETTIQDFGVGIATSVMPHLFEKFYRSHRSRGWAGGSGLGLYLSRAIIEAHGGRIWVQSKEGQGSVFGFTLQAYKDVAGKGQSGDNKDAITRSAHGWIKNHSLYRR